MRGRLIVLTTRDLGGDLSVEVRAGLSLNWLDVPRDSSLGRAILDAADGLWLERDDPERASNATAESLGGF
jgi:hypothetical protein